jgi:hypothetical protein
MPDDAARKLAEEAWRMAMRAPSHALNVFAEVLRPTVVQRDNFRSAVKVLTEALAGAQTENKLLRVRALTRVLVARVAVLEAERDAMRGACNELVAGVHKVQDWSGTRVGNALDIIEPILLASGRPSPCEWVQNDDGAWETGCGNCFEFNAGGPTQNGTRFCVYCSKTIHATAGQPQSEGGEGPVAPGLVSRPPPSPAVAPEPPNPKET